MPFVIIAAGDAREYAPRPLFDWFPLLPVIALGCPVRHLRPVVDYPVLARPVDADRLLAHVRALISHRSAAGEIASYLAEERPYRRYR
jgi:hypothetical protein